MALTENTLQASSALSFLEPRNPLRHLARLSATLGEWQTRRRYRRDLERLLRVGPHLIEDVGLTLQEASREIEKLFWQT